MDRYYYRYPKYNHIFKWTNMDKKQFNMHIEGNILVKNESKIPHSVTGVTW